MCALFKAQEEAQFAYHAHRTESHKIAFYKEKTLQLNLFPKNIHIALVK